MSQANPQKISQLINDKVVSDVKYNGVNCCYLIKVGMVKYNKLMKLQKQKEQPFYVKRIRLKHSVLKTNQILQSISIKDIQGKNYQTVREGQKFKSAFSTKYKSMSKQKDRVNQTELIGNKSNMVNYERMRKLLKVCKTRKSEQKQSGLKLVGLQVRRIVGDPQHKKKSSLQPEIKSSINVRKSYLKTLEESNDDKCEEKQQLFQTFKSDFFVAPASIKLEEYEMKSTEKQKTKERGLFESCEKISSPSSPHRRGKVYLYQKMAGMEHGLRDNTNYVYERRIRSYVQFLWKGMVAHNIYLNLDLSHPQLSFKKMKAYVGYGNNCNMIKGLIKRRFWWVVSEQLTEDCTFIWTQLKINKIYQRQQPSQVNETNYLNDYFFQDQKKRMSKTCMPSKRRHNTQENKNKSERQKYLEQYEVNRKIWNENDKKYLLPFMEKHSSIQKMHSWQRKKSKQISYKCKTKQINEKYKSIISINNLDELEEEDHNHNYYRAKPIVHNHLENNFHLGNKKALFYNLLDFYKKEDRDVFEYIPFTFHIKNGFKDIEYKRFVQYYEKREKIIKKEEEQEINNSKKMRNIWIVKPGQNTNQGRGITVIDQIYQLNNIMKQTEHTSKNKDIKGKEINRTFIVQMYIDRPLLYNDRKFDIRHFILVTNLYGIMRAYWYEEGYIRTSSYPFNIHNFDPEIHLTNDSIQKRYSQYGRYQPANKISYSEFQTYLSTFPDKKFDFKNDMIPKMKNIAKDAIKSVQTKLSPKKQMNNFQIFGLDFMIDRNFQPWLIEINTNPCLDCGCSLLDRIIPYMVEQSLKLSLDLVYPPPCHYPNTSKHFAPFVNLQNFKYELIYDSSLQIEKELKKTKKGQANIMADIGQIGEDEEFQDNGKEIKLEDFT